MSNGVVTHAWMLKDEKRGEGPWCSCGKHFGIRGSDQSALSTLSRLWVIWSDAWRWGLSLNFLCWNILLFERVRTLYPLYLISSTQSSAQHEGFPKQHGIRFGALRKNQHPCCWKSSMADHEAFILH